MSRLHPASITRKAFKEGDGRAGRRARRLWPRVSLVPLMVALMGVSPASLAQAIPTRTIINGNFENFQIDTDAITPVAGFTAVGGCSGGVCERRYSNAQITTEPLLSTFGWRANGPTYPGASTVEVWRNTTGANQLAATNYFWVPHSGNQYAEIASNSTSEPIGQSLCVVAGETPAWSVWHRARTLNGADRTDTMRVRLFSPNGTSLFTSPILSATTTAWVNHTGVFPAASQSGAHLFNFEYVTGPSVSAGNFVDDIDIRLSPLFDLRGFVDGSGTAISTATESGAPVVYLDILVNGAIQGSNATIRLVRSGAALPASDFIVGAPTRGSLTVDANGDILLTLPVGTYDPNVLASAQPNGGGRIRIPLTISDLTVIEDNETLNYTTGTIIHSGSLAPLVSDIQGSSAACATAVNTASLVVIDNDIDLLTTKTASVAAPVIGVPFTYTITYTNNTARTLTSPTTSHDATAAISDPVPAGITFTGWTCVASNGAVCPAVSGSGAITGNAVLPAGSGSAGGTLTYTVTAVATGASSCATTTNISTITTPAGMSEGTSVQPDFASPTPGGTGNNTASLALTPQCGADLQVVKTATPDPVLTGETITYTLVATNNGPANATDVVLTDLPGSGLDCTTLPNGTATCTATGGASCPAPTVPTSSLLGSGIVLPTLPVGGQVTVSFQCIATATGN